MFGDKLKKARISAKLKQSDLAKTLDTTNTTISNWENNVSKPDLDTIEYICGALNVPASYFFNTPDSGATIFTIAEQKHIKRYRNLDDYGKKAVDSILDIEYGRVESLKIPVVSVSNLITLPEFEQPVSAGRGVYLGDGSQTITREIPNNDLTHKANFILRVWGNSMEPEFYDGDKLLVKRQPNLDIGEVGIFVLNGEGFVKKYMGDRLISFNSEYRDIVLKENDEIKCEGRVIGKL